jgi:hypothetical protein
MKRPGRAGSAFRSKIEPDPANMDIEPSLVQSGLLGRTPEQHPITHTKIPAVEYGFPPDLALPIPPIPRSARSKTVISKTAAPKTITTARPSRIRSVQPVPLEPGATESPEAPNVFYGTILPPTDPPASCNFTQLNELLDRLMTQKRSPPSQIIGNVFGEVIRQYYVECSNQGSVLGDCRDFFEGALRDIPVLERELADVVGAVRAQIEEHERAIRDIKPTIERQEAEKARLQKVITDLRQDLKTITERHDSVVRNLALAANELNEVKSSLNQLDNRIKRKNQKLMDLLGEVRILSGVASSYTTDTLRFAENLECLREQQQDGRQSIYEAQRVVVDYQTNIARQDLEITLLTDALEGSRIAPELADEECQVDLISRRALRPEPPRVQALAPRPSAPDIQSIDLMSRIAAEFAIATGKPRSEKTLRLTSYEDYAKLKRILLRYEGEFRIPTEELSAMQNGEFDLSLKNQDPYRLYASSLMTAIMHRAVLTAGMHYIETQTLIPQGKGAAGGGGDERSMPKTRFLTLVSTDYSRRASRQFTWLIETIKQLYEHKYAEDEKALASDLPLTPFPEFVAAYGLRINRLQFLADQFCWDVHISCHEHEGRSLEVDMFVCFLDEKYNCEQLAFFLMCRSDCLELGSAVTVFTSDRLETFHEYYLSQDQLSHLLGLWWQSRQKPEHERRMLEHAVPRPAVYLEAIKKYIAMHDILSHCVSDYMEDKIALLEDMMLRSRILPRMNPDRLVKTLRKLIPELTDAKVNDLHRASVVQGKPRTSTTLEKFIREFKSRSVLRFKREGVETKNENPDVYRVVREEWDRMSSDLDDIFEFFKSQSSLEADNLMLKLFLDETSRFHSNLKHALSYQQGSLSLIRYYQFLFSLDLLFSTLATYKEGSDTLLSMECSIRENWMQHVY